MIKEKVKCSFTDIPFKSSLSFEYLIAEIRKISEQPENGLYASALEVLKELENVPELQTTITDYSIVEKYRSLEGFNYSDLVIKTTKGIDRLSKKLYVLSKSYDEVALLASQKKEMAATRPAIQPISNVDLTRIASGFGWRMHPIYKVPKLHEGIDFTAPRGTDVYATGDGKVTKAKYSSGGYGREVVIDHGFGYG